MFIFQGFHKILELSKLLETLNEKKVNILELHLGELEPYDLP